MLFLRLPGLCSVYLGVVRVERPHRTDPTGPGGGDPIMLGQIFAAAQQEPDPYLRAADHRAGAYSILTGIAANTSIAENRPIRID